MSLVKKLWQGDVSLPIVYWVVGGGTGIIFLALYKLIEHNTSIASVRYAFVAVLVTNVTFRIFWAICLWRTADKYVGDKIWKYISYICALASVFFIGKMLYTLSKVIKACWE